MGGSGGTRYTIHLLAGEHCFRKRCSQLRLLSRLVDHILLIREYGHGR